jgi:glycosyltransferase involved in cell wall biosynthesis
MEKIIFYGFQYPHHGKHSAFLALAEELKIHCNVIKFTHPSFYNLYFGKLRLKKISKFFPRFWFVRQEQRLKNYFSLDRTLIHYFFPEDSLRNGSSWPGPAKIAITLHQPLSYMDTLQASGSNPGFFTGLSRADLIILMSGAEIDAYRKLFPQARVEFIPHGVDTAFFRPVPRVASAGTTLRLLTVGTWLRDYDLWVEIAERLADMKMNIELTVVSNKRLISQTRDKLSKEITVNWQTGLSDELLAKAYQQADLLLLPLVDAWANNALLEAMASGLPILCSDLPATREYLGDDGLFARNADEFVNQIRTFSEDASLGLSLSRKLRDKACKQYSWRSVAERHRSLYHATLNISV